MITFFTKNTKSIFAGLVFFYSILVLAHPMPNSVMQLDVKSKSIVCELHLPLKELQLAVSFDVTKNINSLLKNRQQEVSKYILSHFSINGITGKKWNLIITKMSLAKSKQEATGLYQELLIEITILPKPNDNIRTFAINYDAIVHQVITHKTLITIRQDWENGQVGENKTQIGIIGINSETNKIEPFRVNLTSGSNWKGFKSMVRLGMNHIAEGTDHLLFLLLLLLSAPLISIDNKWVASSGIKYSLIRIIKITTAFTIGHSVTLLIGTFGWFQPQPKIIEIAIALSILITAIHAIRPIFPDKEIYIAAGFGLIHGLAFATVLYNLHLETSKTIISLLGFNIGIEIMQLFVILIIMPWLLLLSTNKIYRYIRFIGGIFASIASIAWILERYSEKTNFVTILISKIANQSLWLVFILACFTIIYSYFRKNTIDR
jgi:hypothetical protein